MYTNYKEYRCPNDNKLLFKGVLIDSAVEVKCRSCKEIITINGEPESKYICMKENCENRVAVAPIQPAAAQPVAPQVAQ